MPYLSTSHLPVFATGNCLIIGTGGTQVPARRLPTGSALAARLDDLLSFHGDNVQSLAYAITNLVNISTWALWGNHPDVAAESLALAMAAAAFVIDGTDDAATDKSGRAVFDYTRTLDRYTPADAL